MSIPTIGEATLRICGAWFTGFIFAADDRNVISINGHPLDLDMDWRGNSFSPRWFGVLEIDIPMDYLREDNEIYMSIVGGGTVSNMSLQLWDYTKAPGRKNAVIPPAINIPALVEAEDFSRQVGAGPNGNHVILGSNDTLVYKVNALITGDYSINYNYTTDRNGTAKYKLFVDDNETAIVTDLPRTGGWNNYADYSGGIIELTKGEHVIKLLAVDATRLDYLEFMNADPILVDSVYLNRNTYSIAPGASARMLAIISPIEASNKSISWFSTNESVLSVDQSGLIKTIAEGDATIIVTTDEGAHKDSCQVRVESIKVTGIEVTPADTEIALNYSTTLSAKVFRSNASDKSFTWESKHPDIAKVNKYGVVTGISPGDATIVATTLDGDFTSESVVNVRIKHIESVSITKEKVALNVGKTEILVADLLPLNASDKAVVWSSENTSIATVNASGVVKGVSAGVVKITVKTNDGDLSAQVEVSVVGSTPLTRPETLGISLYPNPATNTIFIKGMDKEAYSVKIYNVMGMQLLSEKINYEFESGIDIQHLPIGFYIVVLKSGTTFETIRFQKTSKRL